MEESLSRGGGVKRGLEQEAGGNKRQRDEAALPAALAGQAPVVPKLAHDEVQIESDEEKDPHRIAQRQKQIDFGKNTIGYDRYLRAVPKNKRRRGDPVTPPANKKMSKRQFDGLIRSWRKKLHKWDPSNGGGEDNAASPAESKETDSEENKDEAAFTLGIEEGEDSEEHTRAARQAGDVVARSNGHTRDSRRSDDDSEESDDDDVL